MKIEKNFLVQQTKKTASVESTQAQEENLHLFQTKNYQLRQLLHKLNILETTLL